MAKPPKKKTPSGVDEAARLRALDDLERRIALPGHDDLFAAARRDRHTSARDVALSILARERRLMSARNERMRLEFEALGHPGEPVASIHMRIRPDGTLLVSSDCWGEPYAAAHLVAADKLIEVVAHDALELLWMLQNRRKPNIGQKFPRPTVRP